jgi:putative ABC transport system permease protein
MLGYYLKQSYKNLWRNRLYSALCMLGLALALAIVSLIYAHVRDELSFNTWLPGHERVYQILVSNTPNGLGPGLPSDVGLWMREDIPEAEAVTRMMPAQGVFSSGEIDINLLVYWAEGNVFDVLPFTIIAGQAEGALTEPDSVVLSRTTARELFGNDDPIGKTVELDSLHDLTVTAVMEDLPPNSTLQYVQLLAASNSVFSPMSIQDRTPVQQFGSKVWSTATFIKLKPDSSLDAVTQGLADMQQRRTPINDDGKVSQNYPLRPVALADVHLAEAINGEIVMNYNQIAVFVAVGLLVLFAGTINFVNIQVAMGLRDTHAVGIRKSCGADRAKIFWQYMTQSMVLVLISAVLGMMLAELFLPALNAYLRKTLDLDYLRNPLLLAGTVAFFLLVAFLAALYPSLLAANIRPSLILNDRHTTGMGSTARIRQALVVVQFAIMSGLLVATVVVYQQFNFGVREALRNYDDPVLLLPAACQEAFKNSIEQLPGVEGTACSIAILPQGAMTLTSGIRHGEIGVRVRNGVVGPGFTELYGMKLLAGRHLSDDIAQDLPPAENNWDNRVESIVINELAVRALGFASPEEAVGQEVSFAHVFRLAPTEITPMHQAEIVGVVEDFQTGTVAEPIEPTALYINPHMLSILSIKISGQNLPETLAAIEQRFDEFGTFGNFTPDFYDQRVQNWYLNLQRQSQVFAVLSAIAMFISLLGLLALASYAAVTRIKECGIRLCLGSSRWNLTWLFLWQFARPVIIANLIGWLGAWWFMSTWLDGFARRVDLQWWVFVAAFALTLGLALLTVFSYVWRLSGNRPVQSLRYE